jgi:hypothetical protein
MMTLRHCEEQSDAAIHSGEPQKKSWIAAACGLAVTGTRNDGLEKEET